MKVLFITLTYRIGGAENHMAQVIQHWPAADDDLHVLGFWKEGELWEYLVRFAHVHALFHKIPESTILRGFQIPSLVRKTRMQIQRIRPDIVVTFLWFPTWVTVKAGGPGLPIVWSVQNDPVRGYQGLSGRVKNLLTQNFFPGLSHLIVTSPGLKSDLLQKYAYDASRMSVIPNGIDISRIRKLSEEVSPDLSKIEKFSPFLLFLGRIESVKGWHLMLQGVQRVKDIPFHVVILGRGSQEELLRRTIREMALEHRVHYLGFRSNPYPVLRRAFALISTSQWETFGLAMVEAMVLGKPVIATPTNGAKYIVDHEKNGYIFGGFSPDHVEEGIRWLFSREVQKRWDQIQENARTKASKFDAPLIAQKYRKCFLKVIR